ncbi:SNF5-domain-containing protein [Myriangium duriaei CBS 260.36]|uniref:SNF5-domain-containing protein n=1 Tax=Myriangium duriaei CBS 260.36 TaxID=1168546 RepID=A0A9P4MJV9_9PEZI|nr:SNF5-domain-containing protein [Myriangium duriaei CBS 260.36]
MTSPSPHQHINAQPFTLSQPPAYRRQVSATSHSSPQHAPNLSQSPAVRPQGFQDQAEAIRQGKQRAKDMIAAQGIDARPGSGSADRDGPIADAQANGATMTRKRSRSGSPIEYKRSHLSTGKNMQVNDDYSKALLNRYDQRDALADHYSMKKEKEMSAVVRSKPETNIRFRTEVDKFKNEMHLKGHALIHGQEIKPMLVYPADRKRAGNRRTEVLRLSRKSARQQAETTEDLVPLRIDIELEKLRLRDTFTWNLNDRTVPTKLFAEALVEDLQVPLEHRDNIVRQVHRDIKEQLDNYYPPVWPAGQPAEPGMPYWAHKNDDMRITIKLNITVGHITLVDQFEWDINNPANSPEEFALQMAKDLSLSGEFTTAIAHSIREQSQLYIKSLYLTNYEFDGRLIEDPDIRDNMMASPVHTVFRPHQSQKDFSPFLYELSEADLEKTELSMLREQRAQKRQLNRRGGPALPDLKDRQRTARSLVVSSVIPGAAETLEASGILKIRRVTNRGRKRITDDGSDDSDIDMDDSGPDSPAPSGLNIGTTARTRGMRGAASVATAALSKSYGRSATPDYLLVEPPRSASRRSVAADSTREDTAEPNSLVVKLRINPAKFKAWLAKRKFGRSGAPPLSGFPTSMAKAVEKKEPATPVSVKAPSTPAMQNKPLPRREDTGTPRPRSASGTPASKAATSDVKYDAHGRVDAERTPLSGESPPPPPPWLLSAMSSLATKYPTSTFTPLMRFSTLNAATSEPIRFDTSSLSPGSPAPTGSVKDADGKILAEKAKFAWLPRIKCNDCPGKLYTAQRENTEGAFEVHLKMRRHRENVEARLKRSAG